MDKQSCTDVTPDGLYMGPKGFAVTCMNPRLCAGASTCAWRKFHQLDKPGFDHLYRRAAAADGPSQGELQL